MKPDVPESPTSLPYRPVGVVRAWAMVVVFFTAIAPASLLYITICLILLPSRTLRIRAGNLYGKTLGPMVMWMSGIRPVIQNRERVNASRPALYVCNHASTIDMWVGMWLCPYGGCGVAKKQIVKLPFFGQAYLLSGHLLLDRSNRERAIKSMERVQHVVGKHRLSMWMWPEGTRSATGRLQPLKKGIVHLAVATGLPIVPIVFHDADLRWPGRSMRPSPGDLRIEVLEPIDTSLWQAETAGEHAVELWSVFQASLGERQQARPDEHPTAADQK
ncbi:MAG: lysophospholipid acyltransferase family protein [Myxococcota bacterium]|nr:lysophospholipid acyltransferase family protein [Myxococcota bacterium]